MDECKPLVQGGEGDPTSPDDDLGSRGVHSFTSELNLSAFMG